MRSSEERVRWDMAEQASIQKTRSGVRKGTAKRPSGQETSSRILLAARELLAEEDITRFSMRNVANRAGVNLRNLQYYYPSRENLVQALLIDVSEQYRRYYEDCAADADGTPLQQFKAVLDFNMQDVTRRETQQFFMQFWVLLGSLDNFRSEYLARQFSLHVEHLSPLVAALQPDLSETEVRCRAILLDAVLEGVMVVLAGHKPDDAETRDILKLAYDQCLGIALGDTA